MSNFVSRFVWRFVSQLPASFSAIARMIAVCSLRTCIHMDPHGSSCTTHSFGTHIYHINIQNIFIIYIHKCLKWLCPKDIIGYPPKKLSWGTRHLRITKMMFQSVGLGELGLHYLQKSNCQWNVRVSSAIPRSSIFFFNSCTPGGCWTVCLSMRDYGHFRTPLELSQLMKVCHPVP